MQMQALMLLSEDSVSACTDIRVYDGVQILVTLLDVVLAGDLPAHVAGVVEGWGAGDGMLEEQRRHRFPRRTSGAVPQVWTSRSLTQQLPSGTMTCRP